MSTELERGIKAPTDVVKVDSFIRPHEFISVRCAWTPKMGEPEVPGMVVFQILNNTQETFLVSEVLLVMSRATVPERRAP